MQRVAQRYGRALNLTLRDLQDGLKAKGHPWELAKGFDEGYDWEFVVFSKGPAKVTAFIGTPR